MPQRFECLAQLRGVGCSRANRRCPNPWRICQCNWLAVCVVLFHFMSMHFKDLLWISKQSLSMGWLVVKREVGGREAGCPGEWSGHPAGPRPLCGRTLSPPLPDHCAPTNRHQRLTFSMHSLQQPSAYEMGICHFL